jgi:hypothetical protein
MEPSIECIDGASIVPVPTNPMTAVLEGMATCVGSYESAVILGFK